MSEGGVWNWMAATPLMQFAVDFALPFATFRIPGSEERFARLHSPNHSERDYAVGPMENAR